MLWANISVGGSERGNPFGEWNRQSDWAEARIEWAGEARVTGWREAKPEGGGASKLFVHYFIQKGKSLQLCKQRIV